jgi:peptidoglycan/xylan/chitin deacetylase (PgdA/CDA1 family)
MNRTPHSSAFIRPLLLLAAMSAPFLSFALLGHGWLIAFAPLFISHLLLLYPTLVPNCQWWGPVFVRFQTSAREVWMTIDDGPSPAHTVRLLDLLDRFEARATFFVVGANAEKYPHLLTEILTRGHTIANHTFMHPHPTWWCAGPAKVATEIDRCAETLRTTPERPAQYFRAPTGMKNPFVHPALARRGLALIGWTVRGFDTIQRDAARVATRIEKALEPGAILLLHEGHRVRQDPDFHARCLELTLGRLAARGYRCVIPQEEQLRARGGDR